jgi:hypothetical protein
MYNINIFIFIFAALFNKYITNIVKENTEAMPQEYQKVMENS